MKLNKDQSVLNDIYKNAATGSQAINDLLPKVENPQFRDDLQTQDNEYKTIQKDAEAQMAQMGCSPTDLGIMKKLGMKTAVNMNTMMNNDTTHLAELMINGSTMGITNMTKILNGYSQPKPEIKQLADKLVNIEHQNIERLKIYLR